ncbi:MAG: GWxTD domain-containing protein [Acidobacteriia bacterium]|nr:GWxTD domain-containing protein [Terriglobia bacterium]MYG04645.1 GWxTD domain-containing protein [Terriglobia bacterium]MYK08070.1 GWxTD domain-containing protein [Terriglobia bacterium]
MRSRISPWIVALLVGLLGVPLIAQDAAEPAKLTRKQERRRLEKLRKELRGPFKRWLDEDVRYIITPEERKAFVQMATDEERENFIESFWMRRDPTPDSMENEYKEEHYRRIAYANDRYASGIPGWKTDRGRIYIAYGPADEIESHPSGGQYQRPYEEGGGFTSTYPFEIWRYRWIEGIGSDILLEFVDPTMTGEYRLTMDPSEKDALLNVPGAGLTLSEQMGLTTKADRFRRTDGTRMGTPIGGAQSIRYNQFERLQLYANIFKPPAVKFKDLEAIVNSTIDYNTLSYDVDVHFVRVTNSSVLTGITVLLRNEDLLFKEESGLHKAVANIFGRITTMTRRVQSTFEETVSIQTTAERMHQEVGRSSVYNKSVPLAPGMYRLELVVKDLVGETMGTYRTALRVPEFDDEALAASSLIIADKIERVPIRSLGTGQFVIGSSKVRPRIDDSFKRDEKMGIYMQIYNLGQSEETSRPEGNVTYQIARLDSPEELLLNFTEDVNSIRGASSRQVVIEKLLPLQSLEPGEYRLSLLVQDDIKNESLAPTATFKVL